MAALVSEHGDAISVHERIFVTPSSCPGRFDCAPPIRGGLAIKNAGTDNAYDCTSGFAATGDLGAKFIITAGHCDWQGGTNQNWRHHGERFGEMTLSRIYEGRSDFAKIRVDNGWDLWATYYETVEIRSVQNPADDFQGQLVCKSGVRTGYTCGSIRSRNLRPDNDSYDFRTFDGCVLHGDSGGPVVLGQSYNRLAGVVSGFGAYTASPDSCNDIEFGFYGHAGWVDNSMDVTINTIG